MTTRTSRRWLAIALIASVAVNVFLVSAVIGRAYLAPRGGGFERMLAETPADVRDMARSALQSRRDAHLAARRAQFDARQEVVRALRADPFDIDAFAAAQAQAREVGAARRAVIGETFEEIVSRLDASQRAAMADALEARLERRRARWEQ